MDPVLRRDDRVSPKKSVIPAQAGIHILESWQGKMNGEKQYFVYMLASSKYGTIYIGVTSDLLRRVWEHKEGVVEGFTKKYKVHRLVWFEVHQEINEAILREKQLKKWNRDWKIKLIEEDNTDWLDLSYDWGL